MHPWHSALVCHPSQQEPPAACIQSIKQLSTLKRMSMQSGHFVMSNKAWHDTSAGSGLLLWQDGIDRGWFRTNRSALHGLPDLTPILATVREVASGMAHLHSMNILHGDLTSLNVLLASSDIDTRGFIAKVGSVTSPACVCAEWGKQQLLLQA
jgi:serine/threonine protein kinase